MLSTAAAAPALRAWFMDCPALSLPVSNAIVTVIAPICGMRVTGCVLRGACYGVRVARCELRVTAGWEGLLAAIMLPDPVNRG